METRNLTIVNKLGLHARAAAAFVQTASKFASDVWVEKDGLEVNGKSIMGLMMLAAEKGSNVNVRAEGKDSIEAMNSLEDLVAKGFGEV
ncbi:MAG TPA: HPr family phosphocarrier protein [Thermodesulfobacteriota bacterium]|nr:HPr family phosphocarrier protein [Thermodesulfobacteriota bacterium]